MQKIKGAPVKIHLSINAHLLFLTTLAIINGKDYAIFKKIDFQ